MYSQTFNEVLGYYPTRGLDDATIEISSPQAFLGTLGFDNRPLEVYRTGRYAGNTFEHIFFGFCGVVDQLILTELILQTRLTASYKKQDRGDLSFIILSGTLDLWFDAVVSGCNVNKEKTYRALWNRVHQFFETGGFKEVWSDYEHVQQSDSTFTLSMRRR
jgi:hypothetical protein